MAEVMNVSPLVVSAVLGEAKAHQLMLLNHCFHLPVVDAEGKLVGVHVAGQLWSLESYLLRGLQHLALDRAAYWFRVRPEQHEIQVLAVFFGVQDHQRHMLVRLLQNSLDGPGALT